MVRLLAELIAQGRDEIWPSHLSEEAFDIAPLLSAGMAQVKRVDFSAYRCPDCGGCEGGPVVWDEIDESLGRRRIYARCRVEPERIEELDPSAVSVYKVDVGAILRLVADTFGCETAMPVAGLNGVWNCGMTSKELGKYKRRIIFARIFDGETAAALSGNPTIGGDAIVIAADVEWLGSTSFDVFGFADLFRYDSGGLHFDPDPVLLRFAEKSAAKREAERSRRKTNKTLEANARSLATYLKNIAIDLMRLRRQRTDAASRQLSDGMAEMELRRFTALFKERERHPLDLAQSTVYRYLSGGKHANEPYVKAARLWHRACSDMVTLDSVSDVITRHFGRLTGKVEKMDGVELFMQIVTLLPQEMR